MQSNYTAAFVLLHVAVSVMLLAKMKFRLRDFSRQSLVAFTFSGIQNCALSYMLFWTLFYALVYLF
jgi:hypothetical protein